MSDDKKHHWNSLADSFGIPVPDDAKTPESDEDSTRNEESKSETETSEKAVAKAAPKRRPKAAKKPANKKSHWSSLAGNLGLETDDSVDDDSVDDDSVDDDLVDGEQAEEIEVEEFEEVVSASESNVELVEDNDNEVFFADSEEEETIAVEDLEVDESFEAASNANVSIDDDSVKEIAEMFPRPKPDMTLDALLADAEKGIPTSLFEAPKKKEEPAKDSFETAMEAQPTSIPQESIPQTSREPEVPNLDDDGNETIELVVHELEGQEGKTRTRRRRRRSGSRRHVVDEFDVDQKAEIGDSDGDKKVELKEEGKSSDRPRRSRSRKRSSRKPDSRKSEEGTSNDKDLDEIDVDPRNADLDIDSSEEDPRDVDPRSTGKESKRRRPRRRKKGSKDSKDSDKEVLSDSEASDKREKKNRKIPGWEEAIGYIVEANIERRSKVLLQKNCFNDLE